MFRLAVVLVMFGLYCEAYKITGELLFMSRSRTDLEVNSGGVG